MFTTTTHAHVNDFSKVAIVLLKLSGAVFRVSWTAATLLSIGMLMHPAGWGRWSQWWRSWDLSWDHSLKQRSMGTIRGNKMSAVFTCRLCQQLRRLFFEQGYPFTKQSASVGLHLSWSTTQPQKHHHGKHQRLKRLIFPSLWISTRVLEQKLLWVQLRLDLIFRGRVAVDFFPSKSFLITFSPSSQHAWYLSASHYMFSSR